MACTHDLLFIVWVDGWVVVRTWRWFSLLAVVLPPFIEASYFYWLLIQTPVSSPSTV